MQKKVPHHPCGTFFIAFLLAYHFRIFLKSYSSGLGR